MASISHYFFKDIIELKDDKFLSSEEGKLKIWDIDEDFIIYLCKSNIKQKVNLYSNIAFIEEKNEIGAICYCNKFKDIIFKFWKIKEDNSLKEICKLSGFNLNHFYGFKSFIYKTKKFLKILIWNNSTVA